MTGFVALTYVLLVAMVGGSPTPLPKPTGEEARIHAAHEKYTEQWNRHDVAALAATWTEDGDYTEPDGRHVLGRAEVQRLLGYEHASVFKQSRLHLAVERVRFVTQDVAVCDGSYELFDARDPSGKPIGTRAGYFTSVMVKKDADWKLSAVRLMLPQVLIWREER